MSPLTALLVALGLLLLNGLFVAAEFALILARRTQLEPAAAAGSATARMALRGIENLTTAIAAAQLGITICSLGLGAVAEPALANLLAPAFDAVGLGKTSADFVAFVLALGVVTFAHAVLGEMVPKNLALVGPDRAARVLAPFMLTVMAIFRPFVVALSVTARLVVRLFGIEPKREVSSAFTADEVAGILEESHREGLLDEHEYELVTGALEFHEGTVERVLLPRDGLVTIAPSATPADVEQACATTGFSRFPVVDASGDFTGYLHLKDVLETDEASRSEPIADKWVRPLATVRIDSGLSAALRTMQARGSHMARVADADGQVAGVVMLEDVLEELVGEIRAASH
ncbi:MAG: hemolysin family protein [Aeromicrobium sp.]